MPPAYVRPDVPQGPAAFLLAARWRSVIRGPVVLALK